MLDYATKFETNSNTFHLPKDSDITDTIQITHFLTYEAALLDNWDLGEWLNLFAANSHYVIKPLDYGEFDPNNSLYLAIDDKDRLKARIGQLMGGLAWTEKPKSRTRRLITNVQVTRTSEDQFRVYANFSVYQFRNNEQCCFIGGVCYLLHSNNNSFSILNKTIQLDHESIQDQRRVSIIL